ncbi:MAG: galactokinase [Lachnospiraceae bacterium]
MVWKADGLRQPAQRSRAVISPASLEVLTGWALRDIFEFEVSDQEIALISQHAENTFNGVRCGVMDQFAVAMGRAHQAIYLNTENLSYRYVPVQLQNMQLIISCTNKERGLADSKYNLRRMECERALADLQKVVSIRQVGELSMDDFEKYQAAITDDVCRRRARHAVSENARTIQAVQALENNDLNRFGRLMNASHQSLRDDYEVTGDELDALVEAAWDTEGVLGSRMTGAGFGGCTISLVRTEAVDNFIKNVGRIYRQQIGYPADFYICQIGGGPKKL